MRRTSNLRLHSGGAIAGLVLLATATTHLHGQETATFELTFIADWSALTHPIEFPSNPHFSPLIGATHDGTTSFWSAGTLATPGIQQMAELGLRPVLESEIEVAIAAGTADRAILGRGIGLSPGETTVSFDVDASFPRLMMVSMIAPSPDWFVGVSDLDLRPGGVWVDEVTVPLFGWDAGTDSGTTYRSSNEPTDPPQPISALDGPPLGNSVALGQFTVRRLPPPVPTLELQSGRFHLTVEFETAEGVRGEGQPEKLSDDSGTFWFFEPDNIELVVKVLDACQGFDRFWVFAGGLTNVEVTLSVLDTESDETRLYTNAQGQAFQPVQDTDAFATCP